TLKVEQSPQRSAAILAALRSEHMARTTDPLDPEEEQSYQEQQARLGRQREAERSPYSSMLRSTALGLGSTIQSAGGNIAGALGMDDASKRLYESGRGLRVQAGDFMPAGADYRNVEGIGDAAQFVGLHALSAPLSSLPALAGAALTRRNPLVGGTAGSAVPL